MIRAAVEADPVAVEARGNTPDHRAISTPGRHA